MPLEEARSSAFTAAPPVARRSDAEPDVSASDFRALTISVLTSDFTPRLRTVRRAPARACFFADAVRLATSDHQAGA